MAILGVSPEAASRSAYPPHFNIEEVIRPNILALQPYRCARDDYKTGILLDANENALGHSIPPSAQSTINEFLDADLHRYPDPSHDEVKSRIAKLRNIPSPEYIFLGVGSDEVIDLLMRVCCAPGKEKILITPPTYGMYTVCAHVNELPIVKVPLDVADGVFHPQIDQIQKAVSADSSIKLIFLCSPGNPTGTLIPLEVISEICEIPTYKGIVVVDEAYIDFAGENTSATSLVQKYSNIVVMQTLSKSFGLAAIRCVQAVDQVLELCWTGKVLIGKDRLGAAIAQPPLIQILTNTKAPYNISGPTAHLALQALSPEGLNLMRQKVRTIVDSRASLIDSLISLSSLCVGKVIGRNDANFVMLPILSGIGGAGSPDNARAKTIYKRMAEQCGVVVRYRGGEFGCTGCLRITVGTEEENRIMLQRLEESLKLTLPV